jgi:Rad3-related DNA helicase
MREMNRGSFDFQVVNHNLFLADLQRRAQNRSSPLQEYQAVILDEGHKFLDTARDMCGMSTSGSKAWVLLQDLQTKRGTTTLSYRGRLFLKETRYRL